MSNPYLVQIEDILRGKIQLDNISSEYIIVGSKRPDTLAEGINHMAKFGWRSIGIASQERSWVCLMQRVE